MTPDLKPGWIPKPDRDELLAYLFDGRAHLLATQMGTWLAGSRRFTDFVTDFRTKIRKKLHARQEMESLLDLQLELETAYLLLRERSLSLVYEPQLGGKSRGPDFAVNLTTSLPFMVEVTRLRRGNSLPDEEIAHLPWRAVPGSLAGTLRDYAQGRLLARNDMGWAGRLTDMVCSKLGQLLPRHRNILLVGVEAPGPTQDGLSAAMLHLQQRAERDEATVVQRYGLRDRADFFQHYQRLSEVLVRGIPLDAGEAVIGWVNPQAKYPLPSRVRTALYRSLSI